MKFKPSHLASHAAEGGRSLGSERCIAPESGTILESAAVRQSHAAAGQPEPGRRIPLLSNPAPLKEDTWTSTIS